MILEGEFDALLVRQLAGDLVEAVTLGGASDRLNAESSRAVPCAPVVLVATDADTAGEKAAKEWAKLTARARRCKPPKGKDITEAVAAGVAVREWIAGLLDRRDARQAKYQVVSGHVDHQPESTEADHLDHLDFTGWRWRDGGWESPDADLERWVETLDNYPSAVLPEMTGGIR